MNILGIESSCDETAAAVYGDNGLKCNVIASQSVHEQFGGVVPELASRAHHKTISHTVMQALKEAKMSLHEIDAIGVTQGPGLMGSLLVGICFAKGLSLSRDIPLIGVNHIDAHMYANFIDHQPGFPFVSLIVSGGHTRLVHVTELFEHRLLGKTRDDAAGEAFDKIGKILGLSYPAGPLIDEYARQGDAKFHDFPQALLDEGFEFSFSGLKTSVKYYLQGQTNRKKFLELHLSDICASVSRAITEVLVKKLRKAAEQTGVRTLLLAGGVSANTLLRSKTQAMADKLGCELYIPKLAFCTDNGAMIAKIGYMRAQRMEFSDLIIKPFTQMADARREM